MTNDHQQRPFIKMVLSSSRLRKIVPWFAFVALLLLIHGYFMTFRDSEFIKNALEGFRAHKYHQNSKVGPLHILLVAYARTGSSFFGDLLQSLPNSFYHFEPIHFIRSSVLNDSFDEARDLLGKLFICNISQVEGFLPWQMKHKAFMKLQRNLRYWKQCNKTNTCYNGTYIDSFCRNQTIVIAKTIRLDLLEASKLFSSHPHLNLKIIYLARDPRGTMNSRLKKPVNLWCKQDPLCSNSYRFCSGINSDVKAACSLYFNRPDDFMVIRYEDISSYPFEVTEQLINFLGLSSIPDQVYEFLKTHTYFVGNMKRRAKADGLEYPYTTFRNSSITAIRWKKEMNFKSVIMLQNFCKTFLSAFGYHSYEIQATLRTNRDLNVDLKTALRTRCNNSSI